MPLRILMHKNLGLTAGLLLTGCFEQGGVKPHEDDTAACSASQEIPYDGVDQDCDGFDLVDVDGDGYEASEVGGDDCEDRDAAVHPGVDEICDNRDNDCNGLVDGQDPHLVGGTTWYADEDGDGHGDPSTSVHRCSQPSGYVNDATDCDDGDAAVHPGASEVCNGQDNDCDGEVDATGTVSACTGGCGAGFHCLDFTDDVNRDHTDGPWTDNPSESFDIAPGVYSWTMADGSSVDFVIIDPDTNGGASIQLTKGGETWRPSYLFPEVFTINGDGASGSRIHLAGLASGWSDPSLFAGVAATFTISFTDGTLQTIVLENGVNLDDWNHTWHETSSPDVACVYVDYTYGRHIDALTVALDSTSTIDHITMRDDASVHTGTAEKTSVALFAVTVEP